ncbi:hypothetical protein [Embleya scabrispora]|uniref:hypothetical protein n=1 Tax=Embleya scabrispora TaxID=159449 RepID=UPI00131A3B73|nr:hypothetical protein [Embleya scabrispora]MYS78844.1 hypothetical protein [Streptomyces sp. SID5474]
MSIPGEQPHPAPSHGYPQSGPPRLPPPGPYGRVPAQPGPYPQQPGSFPPPAVAGSGFGPAGGPYGPPPGSAGGRGRGWLWALVGAGVASAVWAGAVFATGGFGGADGAPGQAGYRYTADLCAATDLGAFTGFVAQDAPGPNATGMREPDLETMGCNAQLEPKDSTSGSNPVAWITETVTLHKKTDPKDEFGPSLRSFKAQKTVQSHYTVDEVRDLGNEAYLVVQVPEPGKGSDGVVWVLLAVREGGMTYQSTWVSSGAGGTSETTPKQAGDMLVQSARATLAKLRS